MNFERFQIITKDLKLDGIGLEIGGSHSPICRKKDGYNIETTDYLDKQSRYLLFTEPIIADRDF